MLTMYKVLKNGKQIGALHGNYQTAEKEKNKLQQSHTKEKFRVEEIKK
jgi:hypothetical protein